MAVRMLSPKDFGITQEDFDNGDAVDLSAPGADRKILNKLQETMEGPKKYVKDTFNTSGFNWDKEELDRKLKDRYANKYFTVGDVLDDFETIQQRMSYPLVDAIEFERGSKMAYVNPKTRTITVDIDHLNKEGGQELINGVVCHETGHVNECPRTFSNDVDLKLGAGEHFKDPQDIHYAVNLFADVVVNRTAVKLGYSLMATADRKFENLKNINNPDEKKFDVFFIQLYHEIHNKGQQSPVLKLQDCTPEIVQDTKELVDLADTWLTDVVDSSSKAAKIIKKYMNVQEGDGGDGGNKQSSNKSKGRPSTQLYKSGTPVFEDDILNGQPMTQDQKVRTIAERVHANKNRKDKDATSNGCSKKTILGAYGFEDNEFQQYLFEAYEHLTTHLISSSSKYVGMRTPLYHTNWEVGDNPEDIDMVATIETNPDEIIPNITTKRQVYKQGHGQEIIKTPKSLVIVDTSGSMSRHVACVSVFALIEAHRQQKGRIQVIAHDTSVWFNEKAEETGFDKLEQGFHDRYRDGGTDFKEPMEKAMAVMEQDPSTQVYFITDLYSQLPPVVEFGAKYGRNFNILNFGRPDHGTEINAEKVYVKSLNDLSDALLRIYESKNR